MEKAYGNVEGLSPAFVAGADPGSTYKVVIRTAYGYVGVRRLSKYVYKVRCERFDRTPMFTIADARSIAQLGSIGLNVVDEGRRVSGTFAHAGQAINAAGTLGSVLLDVEKSFFNMESCNEEHALAIDAKIDAKLAENAVENLADNDNAPVTKQETKTEAPEETPPVNGSKPKGLN